MHHDRFHLSSLLVVFPSCSKGPSALLSSFPGLDTESGREGSEKVEGFLGCVEAVLDGTFWMSLTYSQYWP